MGFAQNSISGTIKNQNNDLISNVEISISDLIFIQNLTKKVILMLKHTYWKMDINFQKRQIQVRSETVIIQKMKTKQLKLY